MRHRERLRKVLCPLCVGRLPFCICAQLCLTLWDPWTATHQAPLSMGFPRQQYWSGLPFPFSRGSSQPKYWTHIFCMDRLIPYHWATWEAHCASWLTLKLFFIFPPSPHKIRKEKEGGNGETYFKGLIPLALGVGESLFMDCMNYWLGS